MLRAREPNTLDAKILPLLLLQLLLLPQIGRCIKSETYVFSVDQTISKFWKQLASITAVKNGHVEQLDAAYNVTTLHCNNEGHFKNCLIARPIDKAHKFHFYMCHPVLLTLKT